MPQICGVATVGAWIDYAASALAAAGIEEARRRARQLIAAGLDLSATEVFAHPERIVDAVDEARLGEMLARVVAHEPLSRVVGRREFWGLEFLLSAETLDPRPETETVVEAVLARLPERDRPYRFLDLGTGTGCLLIALLAEYPKASGIGIDIAVGASRTARRNAARLGLSMRARFIAGNWGEAVGGGFDAVIANPPYIATAMIAALPPEVRDYDPRPALDGGVDGLAAYRSIAADLPRLLRPGGLFAAEIGAGQQDAVAAILERTGLRAESTIPDLAGIVRCIIAQRMTRGSLSPARPPPGPDRRAKAERAARGR